MASIYLVTGILTKWASDKGFVLYTHVSPFLKQNPNFRRPGIS